MNQNIPREVKLIMNGEFLSMLNLLRSHNLTPLQAAQSLALNPSQLHAIESTTSYANLTSAALQVTQNIPKPDIQHYLAYMQNSTTALLANMQNPTNTNLLSASQMAAQSICHLANTPFSQLIVPEVQLKKFSKELAETDTLKPFFENDDVATNPSIQKISNYFHSTKNVAVVSVTIGDFISMYEIIDWYLTSPLSEDTKTALFALKITIFWVSHAVIFSFKPYD